MFKASIAASKLRGSVEAMTVIVEETRLKFNREGVSTKSVDPANVAMVSLNLPRENFESYEADEGELGIDLAKLESILEMAGAEDTIDLALDEEKHKLEIRMRGSNSRTLTYSTSLLDPSSIRKEPNIPKLDLPAHIVLRGEDLRRAIKAAEKVGDHITLGTDKDLFYAEAKGDVDWMRLELTKDQLIDINTEKAKSMYSLEYLSTFSKIFAKAPEITINLGIDFPVLISFTIADTGETKYMLAPRVESD